MPQRNAKKSVQNIANPCKRCREQEITCGGRSPSGTSQGRSGCDQCRDVRASCSLVYEASMEEIEASIAEIVPERGDFDLIWKSRKELRGMNKPTLQRIYVAAKQRLEHPDKKDLTLIRGHILGDWSSKQLLSGIFALKKEQQDAPSEPAEDEAELAAALAGMALEAPTVRPRQPAQEAIATIPGWDGFGDHALDGAEIERQDLVTGLHIGTGTTKTVFKGRYLGEDVAVCAANRKQLLKNAEFREALILKTVNHTNILRFIGFCRPDIANDLPFILVTELCESDLSTYICRHREPVPRQLVSYMQDIAYGLKHLHEHNPPIIHRDMKSDNILFGDGHMKLSDFGLARVKTSHAATAVTFAGTLPWMAPEVLGNHRKAIKRCYSTEIDVYSTGVLFWEMLVWNDRETRDAWTRNRETQAHVEEHADGTRPDTSGLSKKWHKDLVKLVEWMWEVVPSERPTMVQVCRELERIRPLLPLS